MHRSATGMQLHLLGPIEAVLDGRPIPLGAAKQRAVLAMLALQPNTTVSVDRLVDGLWGEDPPATAPKMVQLYVSQLRRLLAGDGAEIVTHGRGYELRVAGDAVDAVRLERLVVEAGHVERHRRLDVVPRIAVTAGEPRDHARRHLQRGEVVGGLPDLVGREDARQIGDQCHAGVPAGIVATGAVCLTP